MRVIELDGRHMDTRAALHRRLKEALSLPEYYGNNLDALHDCLGEMRQVQIVLRYPQALLNSLGNYGQRVIRLFEDEAAARPDFRFRVEG